jgi:hypothetical protein
MKAMTITALMALLVTIPFIVRKKAHQTGVVTRPECGEVVTDEDLRYAIDDFLT